jgi:hypothetical protein
MVSPLIDLQVCATRKRYLYFDQDLALAYAGDGYLFNFDVLFTVEDGCGHASVHFFSF